MTQILLTAGSAFSNAFTSYNSQSNCRYHYRDLLIDAKLMLDLGNGGDPELESAFNDTQYVLASRSNRPSFCVRQRLNVTMESLQAEVTEMFIEEEGNVFGFFAPYTLKWLDHKTIDPINWERAARMKHIPVEVQNALVTHLGTCGKNGDIVTMMILCAIWQIDIVGEGWEDEWLKVLSLPDIPKSGMAGALISKFRSMLEGKILGVVCDGDAIPPDTTSTPNKESLASRKKGRL